MLKKALTLLLSLATTLAMAAVDVNTASEADLDSVKGIGPGTSSKMLEQLVGPVFTSLANSFVDSFIKRAESLHSTGAG